MKLTIEGTSSRLSGFRYFWLKHVTGFDSSVHCARCLKGSYSKKISSSMLLNSEIGLPFADGSILYLCGVSKPYNWKNNFHLAFQVCNGEAIHKRMYTGDSVLIDGAIEISFNSKKAEQLFPDKGSSFLTCRNFQFGAHYFCE